MYFDFAFARQTNTAKAKNQAICGVEDGNGEGGQYGGRLSLQLFHLL